MAIYFLSYKSFMRQEQYLRDMLGGLTMILSVIICSGQQNTDPLALVAHSKHASSKETQDSNPMIHHSWIIVKTLELEL